MVGLPTFFKKEPSTGRFTVYKHPPDQDQEKFTALELPMDLVSTLAPFGRCTSQNHPCAHAHHLGNRLPADEVPQRRRAVAASGGQQPAIFAEGDGKDAAGVALQESAQGWSR